MIDEQEALSATLLYKTVDCVDVTAREHSLSPAIVHVHYCRLLTIKGSNHNLNYITVL